ncbi:MAG: hypothetical protein E6H07_07930 [Bacteroidetes bacterium]|nr:MAG: hypothetical protein E6H07_07930 [Bacteroidota bacterium]
MQELHTIQTSDLVDMLSKQTIEYSKMLVEGASDEKYLSSKLSIEALQAEIRSRQKSGIISPNPVTK